MIEIEKDCTNCAYFDIETFYGVCNKHAIILDKTDPCEDWEEYLADMISAKCE